MAENAEGRVVWEDDNLTQKMLAHDKVCPGFRIVTGFNHEKTKLIEMCSKCCENLHWHIVIK